MERENRKNALLSKEILAKKEQANAFAMKGGNLRAVAKRMRDLAEELEEEKVEVRKEDKTIRPFTIPTQENIIGDIVTFSSISVFKNGKIKKIKANIKLRKNKHLLLSGPNGIGKSTLLELIAKRDAEGIFISPDVRIGYYRQDFSTLNFNDTVYESLAETSRKVYGKVHEESIRSTVAGFLITGDMVHTQIGSLSEGQKGLVAFAQLVLTRPGLLILDEPTNHINFRHLPIIAKALGSYMGAMILVSHTPEFVEQIRIDETLDLDK
jgi:ATPase subunit of ABC transporter with duplicated ATPase domains